MKPAPPLHGAQAPTAQSLRDRQAASPSCRQASVGRLHQDAAARRRAHHHSKDQNETRPFEPHQSPDSKGHSNRASPIPTRQGAIGLIASAPSLKILMAARRPDPYDNRQ